MSALSASRELSSTSAAQQRLAKGQKTARLRTLAENALMLPKLRREIVQVATELDLSLESIISEYVRYDDDVFGYGNEIYESLEIRAVLHMHNRLVGSWHIERQELLEQMVECAPGERIVDVGFGVPGRYVESALQRPKPERPTILLLDKCQSAQLFSEALLRVWFGRVPDEVAFSTFDLDDVAEVPKGDKYVMFDVIEHAREPDRAMSRVLMASPRDASLILSLPIGPIVPVHHIAWESDDEALRWLEQHGLQPEAHATVRPNCMVDLFAEELGGKFHNLVVRCQRA